MPGLLQVTLPSAEPVALADMKNFLKINVSNDDTLIGSLITAARLYCENATGLLLASRNFVWYRDGFPTFPFYPNPYSPYVYPFGYAITANYPSWNYGNTPVKPQDMVIPANPVTAFDHITYVGQDEATHTLTPGTDFLVDFASGYCRVSPLANSAWPFTAPSANAVAMYFTAGYSADTDSTDTVTLSVPNPPDQINPTTFVTDIPQTLYTAMLMLVSNWYFNREPVTAGTVAEVPHGVQALLDQHRIFNFDYTSMSGV